MRRVVLIALLTLVCTNLCLAQTTIHWKKDYIHDASGAVIATAVPVPAGSDATAPTEPSGLACWNATATSIQLVWIGSTDSGGSGLAGYKIYRGLLPVGIVSSSASGFLDTAVQPSSTYSYSIVAFDYAGNHSSASDDCGFVLSDEGLWPHVRQIGGNSVASSWGSGHEIVLDMVQADSRLYVSLGLSTNDAEVWQYDFNTVTWTQIGGDSVNSSWGSGYEQVFGLAILDNVLYAGLGDSADDAEVWAYDLSTATWTKVGGDSVNSSWGSGYEVVRRVVVLSGKVYAGLGTSSGDAEVWAYNPGTTTWAKVGGDSTNSSWGSGYEQVYAMTAFSGKIYAGLGSDSGDGEVWEFTPGGSWTKIGGDSTNSSWASSHETIGILMGSGSDLYAGLRIDAGDAELWRYTSGAWTKVGGDGVNSSWNTNYESVLGLAISGNFLYAGIGSSTNDAEVWVYNISGQSWAKFAGDGVGFSWTGHESVRSLLVANNRLYVGLGDTSSNGEIWEVDTVSSPWEQIGGDSTNSSWGSGYEIAFDLIELGGKIYATLGTSTNDAEIWEYNPSTTTWTKVGGDSVNSSWGSGYEEGLGMATLSGKLYVGIGSSADDAEVWEYTPGTTNWAKVGGDSVNSSWGSGYEGVRRLTALSGKLYAALGVSSSDAEIWEYNPGTPAWTKVGGDSVNSSWGSGYEMVYSMTAFSGKLYAGLGSGTGDAEVWEFTPGGSWTKVGGDSTNSSWSSSAHETVGVLAAANSKLYAGLRIDTGDAELWEYSGGSWTKIGGDGVNSSWNTNYESVLSIAVLGNYLYAGIGSGSGDAEIWVYDLVTETWSQFGGDSIRFSWSGHESVRSLLSFDNKLYAALGDAADNAEVWVYSDFLEIED